MQLGYALTSKIPDWILIVLAGVLLILLFIPNIYAEISDPLRRQEQLKWYFGEGLDIGDFFEYKICDSILKIPESPDQCYVITLEFLQLLPTQGGKTWIVAVHVDHNVRQLDMIFQVSADSFIIKTDGSTIPYAHSIERTLVWINHHASKFEPQTLAVGKSWGIVASDTEPTTELLLNQVDSVDVGDQTHQTYKIGYSLVKESSVQIKDEFPFPIKAVIYKPVSSHQNTPLAFTVDLLSYSHSNLCYLPVFDPPIILPTNDKIPLPQIHSEIINDTKYDELLDDDSDDEFDTISTEAEIEEIENYNEIVNYENQTDTQDEFEEESDEPVESEFFGSQEFVEEDYGNGTFEISSEDYSKIEQVFGNFTRFLQFLTDTANQIIENQTKK